MAHAAPAPRRPVAPASAGGWRWGTRWVAIPLAFVLLSCVSAVGYATSWDDYPKILLHVAPATSKNPCLPTTVMADCGRAIDHGEVSFAGDIYYNVYLLVAPGSYRGTALGGNGGGIAGLQCGISYNPGAKAGVDVFNWHLCADMEFPSGEWPASCAGNLITWDSTRHCQLGDVGVAGYFYLGAYSVDRLDIVPRPVDGRLLLADCAAQEITLEYIRDAGSAAFTNPAGGEGGYNPCQGSRSIDPLPGGSLGPPPCAAVPVRPTSWSALKMPPSW